MGCAMRKTREKEAEDRKILRLQRTADLVCLLLLQQENLTLEEARAMILGVKRLALRLFPGKEQTFDLIYGSRFRRILLEKFPLS